MFKVPSGVNDNQGLYMTGQWLYILNVSESFLLCFLYDLSEMFEINHIL